MPGKLGDPWPLQPWPPGSTPGTVTWACPEQLDSLRHEQRDRVLALLTGGAASSLSIVADDLEMLLVTLCELAVDWTLDDVAGRLPRYDRDGHAPSGDRLSVLPAGLIDGLTASAAAARSATGAHYRLLTDAQYATAIAASSGEIKAQMDAPTGS